MTNNPTPKVTIQQEPKTKEEIIEGYRPGLMSKLDKHYGEEWKSERRIVMAYIEKTMLKALTAYRQSVLDESANAAYESGCSARTLNAINHLKQL